MRYIFVVVNKTYDYYEFNDNIYVIDDENKLIDWINKNTGDLPVVYYQYTEEEHKQLRDGEKEHYFVEKWEK